MQNWFNKALLVLSLFFVCIAQRAQAKQITKAFEVFHRWFECQEVYQDRNFEQRTHELDENFLSAFKENYEQYFPQLKNFNHFLNGLSNSQINEDGYQLRPPLDENMKFRVGLLYSLIDSDFASLVECFKINGLASQAINTEELRSTPLDIIEKYKAFFQLLFSHPNKISEREYLFAAANRLFEECFGAQTAQLYQSLLAQEADYPIARFLNTVIWHHLVGDGWKHWHQDCLTHLKKESDAGKEIVYIAGGSDLLTLLKNGIYSIRIIDPYLPTQANFYSEGWNFLINGLIGDEIQFNHDYDHITLRRAEHQEHGRFQAKLSNGSLQELPNTTTIWDIVDKEEKKLGNITIQRRFTTHNDFIPHDHQALVISYDEATYVAMPDTLNGWGIDVTQLDEPFKLFVKQLRKPITKVELCNLRIAGLLNASNLKFINFGSDPS